MSISAERLPVKTYTIADGLLRDLVEKIKQDSRGFLWFCSEEGVSRFDGYSFKNFTVADGLPGGAVNDFLETKNGTIYLASDKGLARLNSRSSDSAQNSLFTIFTPEDNRAAEIKVLYQDKSGQIWVGTSNGLYKLIETEAKVSFEFVPLGEPLPDFGGAVFVPSANTLYVSSIIEDRRGTLWIATFGSGLFRLSKEGGVRHFTAPDDNFDDNKITALLEDRDGQIWIGMRKDKEGGVCVLDAEALEKPVKKCYSTKDGLGSNRIRDILQTSDGQIWLATVPGLCRFQPEANGSVCKTYTAENDLCGSIYSLAEDKDGNLWTGSPCGAKKIARYGITSYSELDGLDKNQVNSIFENAAGELFATNFPANGRVVSRFDGEKFVSVKPRFPAEIDYHGYGWHQTVFQDSRGAWWIPTGYGIFRSPDNTSFENLANAPLEKLAMGAKGLEPFRIFEDSRGDIWMATTGATNELFRWERARNVWQNYSIPAGISSARVGTAFAEDRHGNIWIGASSDHGNGALIRYRPNGEFRVFTAADGASSGWTTDIFSDSRGRLWLTTNENGLLRLDETNSEQLDFKRYTPAEGLMSLATSCVTEDEFGRIYIGGWRGVDRLNPDTGQIENFSNADGLPSGYVEAIYRDRKKNIWLMTDGGLARFQPEPVRTRQPPNVLITGLRLGGEPQNISILGEREIPTLNLRSDQRQITIDFVGLGASLGEKLKYEYRFGNSDWTQTDERTVNFANLAADDYQFEIRAVTADRIYSSPATAQFHIPAPVYLRWWFIVLAMALVALLIFSLYRYRLNKLLEVERTRTRIASDLHDDIGTNLSKISLLSEIVNLQLSDKNAESHRLLNSIAEISRESVGSMSDIVWAINPKRDSVLDLVSRMRLHVEKVSLADDLRIIFNAPAESAIKLSMNARRELFLIFKEVVSNAVRHSNCTEIKIDFALEKGAINLQIADNGRGFDTSPEPDGNGLLNIQNRAERNGGKCSITSKIGDGTTINIYFPQN